MLWILLALLAALFPLPRPGMAQSPAHEAGHHHTHHGHNGMQMDAGGVVMHENPDQLPRDCAALAGEQMITVRAGKHYARAFHGTMFAYDRQEWHVAPCTKVTVTLMNEDHVRHQWMLHGLPRYLHPEGMFHIEVSGPGSKTGTFIVPSARKTYLVHCDVAQHMEKGMKAQLKVGGGDGDLPSIPGITGPRRPDPYPVHGSVWGYGVLFVAGLMGTALVVGGFGWSRWRTPPK
ncbi:MAG: copper oxidase [Thermodesulfobacteriota bacterium]